MTKQEKRMMRTYFSDLTLRFCVPLGLCMLLFIVRLIQGGNTPLFSLDFFILLGLALCLLLCQPHYLSRCWKAWKDRRRSDIAKAVVSVSGLTYDPVLYGKSARPGQAVKLMIPDTEQNAYYLSLPSKTKAMLIPHPPNRLPGADHFSENIWRCAAYGGTGTAAGHEVIPRAVQRHRRLSKYIRLLYAAAITFHRFPPNTRHRR